MKGINYWKFDVEIIVFMLIYLLGIVNGWVFFLMDFDEVFDYSIGDVMYIFKGLEYWKYYNYGDVMYRGYFLSIVGYWLGILDNIDVVFFIFNYYIYFFKGN